MVPALQSGCFQVTWVGHADLPSPMYSASAVLLGDSIYVMAGNAPQDDTYDHVFSYSTKSSQWSQLPSHGYIQGSLLVIDKKLTVIGGVDDVTNKVTNNVSTFNNISNNWVKYFPNLLQPRCKPGVLTYENRVIVLGGAVDNRLNTLDDIEVLNLTQPLQWTKSTVKLPEPMWNISLTTAYDQIYIVGYYLSNGNVTNKAFQISVDSILSSTDHRSRSTSGDDFKWTTLPRAPHYNTALLPHSYPPVIVGGDIQGVPTSNVAILDITKNKWDKLASLHTARSYVAVVPISHDSIVVIGGTKGGIGVEASKASCVSTVEKGTVSISHTVATMPTQDSACTIQ